MLKQYNTPSVRVVLLDEADLIVTSNGSDNKETLSVNLNSDVDGASKAPNRSIWGDDWYPSTDLYFASPICQIRVNIGWKTLETFDFRAFPFVIPQIHRNFAPQKQRIIVPEADQRNYLII